MKKLTLILMMLTLAACAREESPDVTDLSDAAAETEPGVVQVATYGDEGLGIRKETLFEEEGVEPPLAAFPTSPPGAGKVLDRAYLDAPPQIPHSTMGLLPITKMANACTGCHMPAVAVAVKAATILAVSSLFLVRAQKPLQVDTRRTNTAALIDCAPIGIIHPHKKKKTNNNKNKFTTDEPF